MSTDRPPTIRPSGRGRLNGTAPENSACLWQNWREFYATTKLLACLLPKMSRFFMSLN